MELLPLFSSHFKLSQRVRAVVQSKVQNYNLSFPLSAGLPFLSPSAVSLWSSFLLIYPMNRVLQQPSKVEYKGTVCVCVCVCVCVRACVCLYVCVDMMGRQ